VRDGLITGANLTSVKLGKSMKAVELGIFRRLLARNRDCTR